MDYEWIDIDVVSAYPRQLELTLHLVDEDGDAYEVAVTYYPMIVDSQRVESSASFGDIDLIAVTSDATGERMTVTAAMRADIARWVQTDREFRQKLQDVWETADAA